MMIKKDWWQITNQTEKKVSFFQLDSPKLNAAGIAFITKQENMSSSTQKQNGNWHTEQGIYILL
jgi:hypothetical protein